MKTDTYFEKQNTRTRGWVRLDRLSGLCILALVLALTGITSEPAGAFDTHSPQTSTPQVQLVSINRTGTNGGNAGSYVQTISADGRFVAFSSDANDLVTNDTNRPTSDQFGQRDVFVRDLQTGTTTLVSVNRSGTNSGDQPSGGGVLSANGRFVAFGSESSDLVATAIYGAGDLFVRDLQTGITTLVSVNRFGTSSGNGGAQGPQLSADGRYIAFSSYSSDLVPNDTNGTSDFFVRDLQTGMTTLVSVNRVGTGSGNGISLEGLTISANGRFVGFVSDASDLVINDTNGTADVFMRDLQTGTTTLVSVNRAGTDSGNAFSGGVEAPSLSADGRFVAFRSAASDLVANDTNGHTDDVFVRDLQAGTTTLVSVNRAGTGSGNGFSDGARMSADGRYVVIRSSANDLVTNDTNGEATDVFVRDLQAGTTTLVSVNQAGTGSGNGLSREGVPSQNGRFVAFYSLASDLVANDTNGVGDVFVRDLQTGTTTLVSVNQTGTNSGNGGSGLLAGGIYGVGMSADGHIISFVSEASNLVERDTNGVEDAFVAKITSTIIVNDFVTFEPLPTYRTTSDSTGCPSGFVGKFGFDARLTNENSSPPLSDLAVKVKSLTNGNLLQNADGGNGGVGSTLTVPKTNGYADGTLSPGESVVVNFNICLKAKKPFTFFVDVLGMH